MDIPQDILEIAAGTFSGVDRLDSVPAAIELIARAILAERERTVELCREIVLRMPHTDNLGIAEMIGLLLGHPAQEVLDRLYGA